MDNKNMDQLLATSLNLKESEIKEVLSTTDQNGKHCFYVFLARSKKAFCDLCGSCTDVVSNGYYCRKAIVSDQAFDGSDVFLKVPRYVCRSCHHSFSDDKHMTPRGKQISYDVIIKVMEILKSPHMTFKEAARLTGISESSVVRIFDEHCHIPRCTFPEAVCIDEVYAPNSTYHESDYVCVFYDFMRHTIIDVLPSRTKNYLHHYFQNLQGTDELNNVKYVVMDMHYPYKQIAQLYMKKAAICADSFHVVKALNDSLSKLRIHIMKRYDTDSKEYYLLKNWRFLLFSRNTNLDNKGKYNKKLGKYANYRQILDDMLSIDPDLDKAWHLKERYMEFNVNATYEDAEDQLEELINAFIQANIPEYEQFTTMLCHWKQEIINSFQGYHGRRLNNSVAESINSQISQLLLNTRGIRNVERRRKRIMYAINKTGFILK